MDNKKNLDFLKNLVVGEDIEPYLQPDTTEEIPLNKISQPVTSTPILTSQNQTPIETKSIQENSKDITRELKLNDILSQMKKLYDPNNPENIEEKKRIDEINKKKMLIQGLRNLTEASALFGQANAGRYSGNFDVDNKNFRQDTKNILDLLEEQKGINQKNKTENRLKELLDIYKTHQADRRIQAFYDAEERKTRQGDGRLEQGQDRLNWQKAEKQELSDKQTEELAGYTEALGLLQNAQNIKTSADTGPISSSFQKIRELVGGGDPELTKLKMNLGESLAKKVKTLSGTAASDKEREFLKSISLPSIYDNDEIFNIKLNEAIKTLENAKKFRIDSFKKQGKDPSKFEKTKKQYSEEEKKVLDWALKNPNHPKAIKILDKLGYQNE